MHHFWRMVWEQNVVIIVMLNNVIEQKKVKSAQYWPLGANKDDSDGYIIESDTIFSVVVVVVVVVVFGIFFLFFSSISNNSS